MAGAYTLDSTGVGVPKPKKDKINRDEIEQEYGLSFALFKSNDELYSLLKKAVGQSWTAQKFQVELRQTKWFQKHSDIWRQNMALKFSDPKTYQERKRNVLTTVQNLAHAFSADLTDKAATRLAERALLFGYNEDQIRNMLSHHVRPSKTGHYGGQLSAVEGQIRETALRNGVRLEREQLRKWMRSIVRGDSSQEQFQTHIRQIASQTFGAYADQIRGGMDVADVAAPYVQSMADILELNPSGIDLYDRTIRRALSHKNEKGEAVPLSISDFEDQLRQDKRWQYTDGAKNQMTEYAIELGKMFGVL